MLTLYTKVVNMVRLLLSFSASFFPSLPHNSFLYLLGSLSITFFSSPPPLFLPLSFSFITSSFLSLSPFLLHRLLFYSPPFCLILSFLYHLLSVSTSISIASLSPFYLVCFLPPSPSLLCLLLLSTLLLPFLPWLPRPSLFYFLLSFSTASFPSLYILLPSSVSVCT